MNIFQYDPNNILNPDHSLNPAADYAYDSDMILVPVTVSKTTSSYSSDTNIIPYLGGLTYADIDNENIKIQVVYSTKIYRKYGVSMRGNAVFFLFFLKKYP